MLPLLTMLFWGANFRDCMHAALNGCRRGRLLDYCLILGLCTPGRTPGDLPAQLQSSLCRLLCTLQVSNCAVILL